MSTINCPHCGSEVAIHAEACSYCGNKIASHAQQAQYQGAPPPPDQLFGQAPGQQQAQHQGQYQQGQYQQGQGQPYGQPPYGGQSQPYGQPPYGGQGQPYGQPPYGGQSQPYGMPYYRNPKNKIAAGLLGIFLGGLGIHKFYLGRIGWGIVYILFCWTGIPALAGFIEGIVYLASSDQNFHDKYSR